MNDFFKLNDVFTDTTGNIFFTALKNRGVPWANTFSPSNMRLYYFGNVSGNKFISPLVYNILNESNLVSQDYAGALADISYNMYINTWTKLWDVLLSEYNPIENYSMTEQMENDKTVDEYGKTNTVENNLSHGKTGTETDTPNVTETQTPNLSNTTDNSVYGFNTTTAVPIGSESQNATGTNTNTRTGTDTREYNLNETDTGDIKSTDGGSNSRTRNYKLSRSGNIGVTTSQQMLQSEIDLWQWNFFRDVVFPDLDKVLTIQIY